MAYIQTRQVSAGQLITGTFEELVAIKREIAIYFALFLAATVLSEFLGILSGLFGFLLFAGYFVGQYWLFRAAFGQAGLGDGGVLGIIMMFFMALLLGFGIYIGFSLFFIPGILLGAKWIMAPAYLVKGDENLFEAIGSSWRASSNNLLPLSLAFAAMWLIFAGLFVVFAGINGGFETAFYGSRLNGSQNIFGVIGALAIHLLPILMLGLSVTAYRALGNAEDELVAVFE